MVHDPKRDMRRIAFYGGTFDPVHNGHLAIATALVEAFELDEFVFLPAFHAPHKPDIVPANAFHRYAMLCLATQRSQHLTVSLYEIEKQERRFSFDTLTELNAIYGNDRIFFVMGADSWLDIRTWHRWEELLMLTSHIVVSRPGYPIGFEHIPESAKKRIVDLRGVAADLSAQQVVETFRDDHIYITDAVVMDVSATDIREDIGTDDRLDRTDDLPAEVANYLQKYELYK